MFLKQVLGHKFGEWGLAISNGCIGASPVKVDHIIRCMNPQIHFGVCAAKASKPGNQPFGGERGRCRKRDGECTGAEPTG